jgi:GNAT superfamily N-acetyltransferase
VILRSAEPGDETAIAEVHVLAWQATYRGMIPDAHLDGLSVPKRRDIWRELIVELEPPVHGAFVALDGSRLVGFAHFCPSRDRDADPDVGEITAIYVHPDFWGKGIGRRLMRRAVDSLEEAGLSTATLWVLDVNARARKFYEQAGWMTDGATKEDQRDGFTLHEVRYATGLRAQ